MQPLAFPAEPKLLQLLQPLKKRRSVAVGDG